tara:strand:+ start:377 stop:670 length:294 start_codon:yes stop_codon:yes gene_type:complete
LAEEKQNIFGYKYRHSPSLIDLDAMLTHRRAHRVFFGVHEGNSTSQQQPTLDQTTKKKSIHEDLIARTCKNGDTFGRPFSICSSSAGVGSGDSGRGG